MTTDEAKAKVLKDVERIRELDKLGDACTPESHAMAGAMLDDSINTLIKVAKAEGEREALTRLVELAEEAKKLSVDIAFEGAAKAKIELDEARERLETASLRHCAAVEKLREARAKKLASETQKAEG